MFNKKFLLDRYYLFFIAIVLVHLVIRLITFEFQFDLGDGDVMRDYLIVHRFIAEGAFPLLGPDNYVINGLYNSPLYYYLMSLPLLVYDDLFSWVVFNIFLQIFYLYTIYSLTTDFFGNKSAVIATAFLSLAFSFVAVDHMPWQPTVMIPLLFFSFDLLRRSYQNRSINLFYTSSLFYILAIVVHNSAVAFLPAFFACAWYVSSTLGFKFFNKVSAIFGFLGLLIVFYLPNLYWLWSQDHEITLAFANSAKPGLGVSPDLIFARLTGFFSLQAKYALPLLEAHSEIVALGLTCLVLAFYIVTKQKKELIYFSLVLLFLVCYILFYIFTNVSPEIRYVQSSVSIVYVIFGVVIGKLLLSNQYIKPVGIILIIALLASNGLYVLNTYNSHKYATSKSQILEGATQSMFDEIIEIKKNHNYVNDDFFQIDLYRSDGYKIHPAILIVPLESKLKKNIVNLDLNNRKGYRQGNDDHYLFVGCLDRSGSFNPQLDCSEIYNLNIPNHEIKKRIYTSERFELFLAEREI